MKKKIISLALGGLLVALNFPAEAQQSPKLPRIGYVTETGDLSSPSPNLELFARVCVS